MKKTRYLLAVLLSSVTLMSSYVLPKGEPPPEIARKQCTSDANCGKGLSCWYQIPRGPSSGIRGSRDTPGWCWSNDVISRTN